MLPDLVDVDDVRMLQPSQCFRLRPEAQQLGLYNLMLAANGIEIHRTDEVIAPGPVKPRDNVNGTAFKLPRLSFCHPTMQQALIESAAESGASVERGVTVTAAEVVKIMAKIELRWPATAAAIGSTPPAALEMMV